MTTIIGVDPGATTGICVLPITDGHLGVPEVAQLSPGLVLPLVRAIVATHLPAGTVVLALEAFVSGSRAGRSATPEGGEAARNLIGALRALQPAAQLRVRPAVTVKAWATDKRLHAAGLAACRRGMRHAADAARHALYAATADCGLPDPLSSSAAPPARP